MTLVMLEHATLVLQIHCHRAAGTHLLAGEWRSCCKPSKAQASAASNTVIA